MVAVSIGSSVSSTISGSPHILGVAAARTYSHRGVMTATPKDTWLGFTRWTRTLGLLKRRKNVGNRRPVSRISTVGKSLQRKAFIMSQAHAGFKVNFERLS
jgi:hypothetical protein